MDIRQALLATGLATGLGIVALALSSLTFAQQENEPTQEPPNKGALAVEINDSRKQNAAQMRNYSWNTRTEIKLDGEVKSVKVELVRYTTQGELQKALVSDSAAGAKKPRGIRGKIASNKKKGMQEWALELGTLLQQYSLPTPGSILDFMDNATASRTGQLVNLVGTSVIQADDYMSILVDTNSKQLKVITVKTRLETDVVDMMITSKTLDDGLSYTAKKAIKVPARKVELTVENYDFRRF